VLTPGDIACFRAFGFVVVRGCIPPAQVRELDRAFERSMADAPAFDAYGRGGSRMCSHAEDADPAFAALIGHVPLAQALESSLSVAGLYIGSFLLHNCDDTPWHTTGLPGEGAESIRASIYLESTSEEQGALTVIAGSHHHSFSRRIFDAYGTFDGPGFRLRLPASGAPGAVSLDTEPGDVILWYTRLWHAARKRRDGAPRRGIFLTYLPDPGDDAILAEKLRRNCRDLVSVRRPFLYGPSLRAQAAPGVAAMARRLEALGVNNVWPL
jgi:hypothetical protein